MSLRASLGFVIVVVVVLTNCSTAQAQPREGRSLRVSGGLGYSIQDEYVEKGEPDPAGQGFYGETEYSIARKNWFGPRFYGGVLLTTPDRTCKTLEACDVSAKIGFLGAKVRLAAPIPIVAPFFEFGLGTSFGVMSTRTPRLDERMSGLTYHVPVTLGAALGRSHRVEVALAYLYHPTVRQIAGAVAIGLDFPRN